MAARRLLIVMLILLGVSTVAAALAPTRSQQSGDTTAATTVPVVPPPSAPPGAGRAKLLKVETDADSRSLTLVPGCSISRRVECLRAGDELILQIRSKRPDQVEIVGLGEVAAVSRYAPAHFDLLLDQPGAYNVRLVDTKRVIARLVVSPAAQPGRARAKASSGRGQR